MNRRETVDWICRELSEVYPLEEARAMAFILLEAYAGLTRTAIFLDPQAECVPPQSLVDAQEQLQGHRPLQYVLGGCEFDGLRLHVDERVLIPRPETEELVRRIAAQWRGKQPRVLDIGTGSGAIAVALARRLPGAEVTGLDISADALDVARENAREHGAEVCFMQLDILTETPTGQYDIIVSNPPYVRASERAAMRRNVLDYEPEGALFVPDDDPLVFYRRIAALGRGMFNEGGALWFEINEAFGAQTAQLLAGFGYTDVEVWPDIFGRDRMVSGRWEG